MKLQISKGATDVTTTVFIPDSTTSDGSGLTSLTYQSSGLKCYYVRPKNAAVEIALTSQTPTGAHVDGGFCAIDTSALPGFYRLDLVDAMFAAGADSVAGMLRGATSMPPTPFEIELVAYNPQNSNNLGLGYLDTSVSSRGTGSANVDTSSISKAVWDRVLAGAHVANQAGWIVGMLVDTSDNLNLPARLNIGFVNETAITGGTPDVRVVEMDTSTIKEATFDADTAKYQAKLWMFDNSTSNQDVYAAAFFKNGEPIVSGITSPTIRLYGVVSGTDLIAETAMVEIAATGTYRHVETSNQIVPGVAYFGKLSATIDGSARTWYQPIGRDSA